MPVGWFIVPSEHYVNPYNGMPGRRCAMVQHSAAISAASGAWSARECFGDHWVCKVRASDAVLDAINATTNFAQIPRRFTQLDTTLGDLTTGERNTITTFLVNRLGFTATEITNAVGSTNGAWRTRTLRQVLNFMRSRWRRPGSNGQGGIVFEASDWPGGAPGTLNELNAQVADG